MKAVLLVEESSNVDERKRSETRVANEFHHRLEDFQADQAMRLAPPCTLATVTFVCFAIVSRPAYHPNVHIFPPRLEVPNCGCNVQAR